MAITPPKYAPDAIPTRKGWVSPKGELLVSRKFTAEQIDEFYGVSPVQITEVTPEVNNYEENNERMDIIGQNGNDGLHYAEVQQLNEAPVNNTSLKDMTKAELKALAEQYGIEVPSFANKAKLVELIEQGS